MINKYFNEPTQVRFKDDFEEEPRWIGGIAYRDEVICMECGSTVDLEDVVEIEELPWISLSEEVMGDDGDIVNIEEEGDEE